MAYLPTIAPKWVKVTKTYTDFATAGLTNNITIYSLPAKGVIHSVQVNPSTIFSGGLIATYTISIGITGVLAKYAIATNVFTGATLPIISNLPGIESLTLATDIKAAAISTIGNLNAATQGVIDIWILVSQLV